MRVISSVFISIAALVASEAVSAEESSSLTVVPGIDFGFKQSSLEVSVNGGPYKSAYNPNYITLIPSLSLVYGQLYASMSYDTPLTEYHTSTSGNAAAPDYLDSTYSRQETTFTLGYRLQPVLTVFGGYVSGETKTRSIAYGYNAGTGSWQPFPSDGTFKSSGYFAGLSTSHGFDDKGTLTVSAAYALMSGSLTSNSGNVSGVVDSQEASGYSTSVSWTGPLAESFYYRVGFRYAKYYYKFQTQASMRIQEPVQGLTFGVSKHFQ